MDLPDKKVYIEVCQEFITRARQERAVGGECGDCEEASKWLRTKFTAIAGSYNPDWEGQALGVHEFIFLNGWVLDPTAAQFTEICQGRSEHAYLIPLSLLRQAGLEDAVRTGVFTEQQHKHFLALYESRAS